MKELSTLALEHGVEHSLYHSSNLAKIFGLLGKKRHVEITKNLLDFDAGEKETWKHVLDFLDKEIRDLHSESSRPDNRSSGCHFSDNPSSGLMTCHICEKTGHAPTLTNNGKTVINYHSCEKFVKMSPKERFEGLKRKNFCSQCLTPGRKFGHGG